MKLPSIISLNIRGLVIKADRTKISQLQYLANEQNALAIVISESWLEESIVNSELSIENYTVYRADRKDRIRGGVCIFVNI